LTIETQQVYSAFDGYLTVVELAFSGQNRDGSHEPIPTHQYLPPPHDLILISMILIVAAQAYGRLCPSWAVAVFARAFALSGLPCLREGWLRAPADAEAIAPEKDSWSHGD
jgi:hypothetical protein